MKIRIIGLSLVFAALTSETVAQPVQHYYDESTAAFYDQYPKASYLSVDEMKKAFEQHSQGDWMQRDRTTSVSSRAMDAFAQWLSSQPCSRTTRS